MSAWPVLRCASALLAALPALAATQAAPKAPAWQLLVESHVERQNANAAWRTVVEFAPDEAGPPACQRPPRVVDSARPRWLGPLTLVLQCDQPAWRWPANIRVRGLAPVVQTVRALPVGTRLNADDLRLVEADLATEPGGVATTLEQVIGRETARTLRENVTLTLNVLRAATVIRTGDRVSVRVLGQAFQVSADGIAQQGGAVGDTIRVKMADGKQVPATVVGAGHVDVKL